jgi:hypothetical protein
MKIRGAARRRTRNVVGLTLAMMVIGSAAVADAPIVTITAPADGHLVQIETTAFPYILPVAGTITHTHNQGNVNLSVTVNGTEEHTQTFKGPDNAPWGFDYSVTGPGDHVIVATATQGSDSGTHEVTVGVTTITVSVDYPAAPSVAGALLQAAGVGNRYGTSRSGGNCVADVARQMGAGTDFNGTKKDDVSAYAAAVATFLNSISHNGTYPCNVSNG